MVGVKVALGSRVMTVGAYMSPGAYGDDCERRGQFYLISVLFRKALERSGGLSLERGRIPLHDVVRINCEKCVTIKRERLQGECLLIVRA